MCFVLEALVQPRRQEAELVGRRNGIEAEKTAMFIWKVLFEEKQAATG